MHKLIVVIYAFFIIIRLTIQLNVEKMLCSTCKINSSSNPRAFKYLAKFKMTAKFNISNKKHYMFYNFKIDI